MNALSEILPAIESLVHKIAKHPNDPLYTVIDQGNGMHHVTPTHLTTAITDMVRYHLNPLLNQFPIHEFHPYINVFIKNVRNGNLMESIQLHDALNKQDNLYRVGQDYEIMQRVMTQLMDCVQRIRQEVQSTEFKFRVSEAYRASQKNLESLMEYIDSLFEHYYQLLVVRVDLSYKQGNVITSYADIEAKYREAKQDFQHFWNNAKKNSLFKHKVGHIWTLEYGPDKGFHFHLYVFFDGDKETDDVYLSWMICNYWIHGITQHRGHAWNCNDNKANYDYCALGMIHHNDMKKRNYLKKAAAYLIKVDHYSRMLTPDHSRNFGKGKILPPRTENPGRPRLSEGGCSVAR